MSIIQKSQKALEYDKILSELAAQAKTEQSRTLCLDLTPYVRHDGIPRQRMFRHSEQTRSSEPTS